MRIDSANLRLMIDLWPKVHWTLKGPPAGLDTQVASAGQTAVAAPLLACLTDLQSGFVLFATDGPESVCDKVFQRRHQIPAL
jgi:hypothetical protein